jgi:hypothetical protein
MQFCKNFRKNTKIRQFSREIMAPVFAGFAEE